MAVCHEEEQQLKDEEVCGGGSSFAVTESTENDGESPCGSAKSASSSSLSSTKTAGITTKPNRRWNRHTAYRDYSRSPPTPAEMNQLKAVWASVSTTPAMRAVVVSASSNHGHTSHHPSLGGFSSPKHHKEPTFPLKLHMILSRPEWHDVVCWLPHGRSFRILNPQAFEELVLPLYYQHAKYASFARQLNGWNFKRVSKGDDFNSYYHEVREKRRKCFLVFVFTVRECSLPSLLLLIIILYKMIHHHHKTPSLPFSCFFEGCPTCAFE